MPNTTVSGIVAPSGPPEKYVAPTTGVLDQSFMIVTYPLMVPLVPTIVTPTLRNNAEWQDSNAGFTPPIKLPPGQTTSVPAYAAPPAGGGVNNPPAGELVHATGCTAGAPGVWSPGGCQVPVSIPDAPRPTVLTNWTVGQYIVLRGGGAANEINWNGTTWVAGRHAEEIEMPEEKAPEGVDEKLWQANRDLQKQVREQLEQEEQDKRDAAAKAAADPNAGTTSTLPAQTVQEAGAENERRAKEHGMPPLAEANEKATKAAPKKP